MGFFISLKPSSNKLFIHIFNNYTDSRGRGQYYTGPIMSYGFSAFPEMGIKGATWGTVKGQSVSVFLFYIYTWLKTENFPLAQVYEKKFPSVIKNIYH